MVVAIFIIVVLAALGGVIASTSTTQQLSIALDFMNARAHQAARAGIDWGVYQAVSVSPSPAFRVACEAATAPANDGPETTLDLATGSLPGLADFRVDVDFEWWRVAEGGSSYCIYQITATACTDASACPVLSPGQGYVEHRQVARVKSP